MGKTSHWATLERTVATDRFWPACVFNVGRIRAITLLNRAERLDDGHHRDGVLLA